MPRTGTEDIHCDLCGVSCKQYLDKDKTEYNLNCAIVIPEFGYGSILDNEKLPDKYICENCYIQLFKVNNVFQDV